MHSLCKLQPPECQAIIQKLKACYQDNNNENLLQELQQTSSWTSGKCELFHWVDVLNIFDDILEHGARRVTPGLWSLAADTYNKKVNLCIFFGSHYFDEENYNVYM